MDRRTSIKTTGEYVLGLMMFIAKVIAPATPQPVTTSITMIDATTTGMMITAMVVTIAIIVISSASYYQICVVGP